MAAPKVRLNHAGIAAILKSGEMRSLVDDAAAKVAANVEAQGIKVGDRDGGSREYDLPVRVDSTTTDRAHATVALAHPSGTAVQAKHGALTRAASAAGLSVKGGD